MCLYLYLIIKLLLSFPILIHIALLSFVQNWSFVNVHEFWNINKHIFLRMQSSKVARVHLKISSHVTCHVSHVTSHMCIHTCPVQRQCIQHFHINVHNYQIELCWISLLYHEDISSYNWIKTVSYFVPVIIIIENCSQCSK